MRTLLALLLLLNCGLASAEGFYPSRPDFRIIEKIADSTIAKWKVILTFHISANSSFSEKEVQFSDNGKEKNYSLNESNQFVHKTRSGDHLFMFYLNEKFREIITDSIDFEGGHRYIISLNFKSTEQQIMVRKPVIYLYPEQETDITVKVEARGELTFTYPLYNEMWKVHAHPDGQLDMGDNSYRYLFWESKQKIGSDIYQTDEGFYVASDTLTNFLESQLDKMSFTDQEKQDFITYWLPLMNEKKNLYISFLVNEQCDVFAELKIEPKPTNTVRFYMLWSEADPDLSSSEILKPQELPSVKREGFTVVEWGGAELNMSSRTLMQ